jgi:hypothetical protein
LDFERKRRVANDDPARAQNPEQLVQVLLGYLKSFDGFVESYSNPSRLPIDEGDRSEQLLEFVASRKQVFNVLCDTMIRIGMAEGWAQSEADKDWAREFVVTKALPLLFSGHFSPIITQADQTEAAMLRHAIHSDKVTAELHHENWMLLNRVDKLSQSVNDLSTAVGNHQVEFGVVHSHLRNLSRWISDFSLVDRAKFKVQRVFRKASNG